MMRNEAAAKLLSGWSPPDTYAEFCAVLIEGGALVDPDDILDYIRKPWKWAPEYAAWVNAGQPQPDDKAWATFADMLNRLMAS